MKGLGGGDDVGAFVGKSRVFGRPVYPCNVAFCGSRSHVGVWLDGKDLFDILAKRRRKNSRSGTDVGRNRFLGYYLLFRKIIKKCGGI